MPRPSQCAACLMYENCLIPGDPLCAERSAKRDPLGRLKTILEDALPAINVLTLKCPSKVTVVGEDGSRIWIGCSELEGHYNAQISSRHRNKFGGTRRVEITWEDE